MQYNYYLVYSWLILFVSFVYFCIVNSFVLSDFYYLLLDFSLFVLVNLSMYLEKHIVRTNVSTTYELPKATGTLHFVMLIQNLLP